MIHTSSAYKKAIISNREFCIEDKIIFADGTQLPLTMNDFMAYSIDEATSSAGKFEVGTAVIKEYTATLNNLDGKFDKYDFEGANIVAVVGLRLEDGTWEKLNKGTYRVVSAKTSEITINIKAYDSMLFFDVPYSTSTLAYPATINQIVAEACQKCGMTYDASTVEMGNYLIKEKPDAESLTFRDIISYCAQIMGCYARIDHLDKLSFGWYAFESYEKMYDGGIFDRDNPYSTGNDLDGGNFINYLSGDSLDGGTFEDMGKYHHFYNLSSQTIHTDDITITGIVVSAKGKSSEDTESFMMGNEGYALEISDNPLIQIGAVMTVAQHLGEKLIGNTFRSLSITCRSDPSIEAGDAAMITDHKDRSYQTVITNTTFNMGGLQKIECSAETPTEKSYTKYGAGTKLLARSKEETGRQLSVYDLAVQNMNQLAANTMGFYTTTIKQEDGSTIAYRHDKPDLEESKVIYKSGIDGFFVSRDGGKTYVNGFDSSGNATVNILSVIGINFDWAHGGTLTLGGQDNVNGLMKILDASGKQIGSWGKDGIIATTGKFSGELNAASGTFSGEISTKKGYIGGYTIDAQRLYNGGVGMSSSSDHYAFWAGESNGAHGTGSSNALFKVGNNGRLQASSAIISGEVNATSGVFDSITIQNSAVTASSLSGNAGTISGGTYSSPYISGGSVLNTGGTYTGTCSGSTMRNCSLGGTSLTSGNGDSHIASYQTGSMAMYANSSISLTSGDGVSINGATNITGGLSVSGSKSRVISTEHYGSRYLDALETPTPTFSDYGKARLNENGECYIIIDPIFAETVNKTYEPTVFLTKYGQGDIWVEDESTKHDVIFARGTPGLKFAWETRYQQIDSWAERLRENNFEQIKESTSHDVLEESIVYIEHAFIDYGTEGANYYQLCEGRQTV